MRATASPRPPPSPYMRGRSASLKPAPRTSAARALTSLRCRRPFLERLTEEVAHLLLERAQLGLRLRGLRELLRRGHRPDLQHQVRSLLDELLVERGDPLHERGDVCVRELSRSEHLVRERLVRGA